MRSYAENTVFSQLEQVAWRTATQLVDGLNRCLSVQEQEGLRCHELARAVAHALGEGDVEVVDGYYGYVNHSWLRFKAQPTHLLDVYAVGRMPMVQLVDAEGLLPEYDSYRKRSLAELHLNPTLNYAGIGLLVRLFNSMESPVLQPA